MVGKVFPPKDRMKLHGIESSVISSIIMIYRKPDMIILNCHIKL